MNLLHCFVAQDAEAAAREDVQQVLDLMADYRRRWESTWDEQERRLRQNLQICQFNYDLRQVSCLSTIYSSVADVDVIHAIQRAPSWNFKKLFSTLGPGSPTIARSTRTLSNRRSPAIDRKTCGDYDRGLCCSYKRYSRETYSHVFGI